MSSFQEGFTLLKFFKVGLLLILWNAGSAFGFSNWKVNLGDWNNPSVTFNIYEHMELYSSETIHDLEIPLTIICNEKYRYYSNRNEEPIFEFEEENEYRDFFEGLISSLKAYVPTLCQNSKCGYSKRNFMWHLREVLGKNGLLSLPTSLFLESCRHPISTEIMVVGPFAVVNGSNLIPKSPAKGIECVMDLREDLVAPLKNNPLSQKDWIAALDKYKINRRSCISPLTQESYISCVCGFNEEFHKWACKEQDEKAVETVLSVNPELYGYAENYVFEIRWFCKIFEKETDIKFPVTN